MKDILKNAYRLSLFSSIIFLIFGILLFLQTEGVIEIVSIIIGVVLILAGIGPIISYFGNRNYSVLGFAFIAGLFSVIAGLIIISNTNILATLLPILAGVWMIINGVNKIQLSIELRDNSVNRWYVTIIYAILIIIIGIFLVINPIFGTIVVTKFIGLIIVVYAVLDIINCITIKKEVKGFAKDIKGAIEPTIIEADSKEKKRTKKQ